MKLDANDRKLIEDAQRRTKVTNLFRTALMVAFTLAVIALVLFDWWLDMQIWKAVME
jgi:hypothetical protein